MSTSASYDGSKPSVAIVKYNAGNVRSVQFALARLGVEPLLTDDPAALRAASHVIFPGVGEASSAMRYLREHGLDEVIPSLTQPVLGICLGLQLMCRHSEEANTTCFGILDADVKRFEGNAKIPQIGWNTVHHDDSPLFEVSRRMPTSTLCTLSTRSPGRTRSLPRSTSCRLLQP